MTNPSPRKVPRLAEAMLEFLAGSELRDHLVGDLAEEFASRPQATAAWYWKEMLRAVPGLVQIRIGRIDGKTIGMSLALSLVAYFMLFLWGNFVTRPLMIGIRDYFPGSQSLNYMLLYIPVRMSGIFLVALLVARLKFEPNRKLLENMSKWLMPLALLLAAPPIIFWTTVANEMTLADLSIRICADVAALVMGGIVGRWLVQRAVHK